MQTSAQFPLFIPPAGVPSLAVEVHALSIPARTFTGDFYFAQRYGDRLWFAAGDVAGKGIAAAVVMAMIQEELEQRIDACASTGCDPASTAVRLDTFLKSVLPPNRFATAVVGSIDDGGTLRIVNAGHCPPLIARRDGSIESIASTGPVLGILPGARWSSARVTLSHGDVVIAYSDGVIEAANQEGEEYGCDRLREAFLRAVRLVRNRTAGRGHALPDVEARIPREIAEEVERWVRAFAPSYGDDLTIVVAQRQ